MIEVGGPCDAVATALYGLVEHLVFAKPARRVFMMVGVEEGGQERKGEGIYRDSELGGEGRWKCRPDNCRRAYRHLQLVSALAAAL